MIVNLPITSFLLFSSYFYFIYLIVGDEQTELYDETLFQKENISGEDYAKRGSFDSKSWQIKNRGNNKSACSKSSWGLLRFICNEM